MTEKTAFSFASAALLICFLYGCGQEGGPTSGGASKVKKEKRLQFAFVTNAVSNFWTLAKIGVDDAAEEFGVEVEFRMPPTGAIAEQKGIIEDIFNKGVDGITVSPIDAANQTEFLNSIAKYIPVLCHDSDAPDSDRTAYVGTDNYQAGREAGKLVKEVLPEGGKIMLFVGRLDAQNAQDRKRGIEEEIAGSNVEIVDTRTDGTDTAKARSNAEDALVANPDLKCLVGLWSYNGPALADALKGSGKIEDVEIVCFDEDEQTLQGIQDGVIHATVVQKPYQMGYQTVRLLTEIARGNKDAVPESGVLDTGVKIVRKNNVKEFWDELKELTGN
jgi:ribose transport system substrate-binding protein